MSKGKWTDETRIRHAIQDFTVESFVKAWDWDYLFFYYGVDKTFYPPMTL